jgi:hypothetical protein
MNHLLRRLRNRLTKFLPFSNENKIVPYLESSNHLDNNIDDDDNNNEQQHHQQEQQQIQQQSSFILRKKSKPNSLICSTGGGGATDLSFIDNLIGTSPHQAGIISFIISLNIECSIRQVMRTYYRCHDPSNVAHFAFTEYAKHPNYIELLSLLRIRLSKPSGTQSSLSFSLLKAFQQLQTCLSEIHHELLTSTVNPSDLSTPLTLGDAAAAILDMVLEIMLTYTHIITFESKLLTLLVEITHQIHQISMNIDLNDEVTRVIWCQMTTRLCHMIEASLSQQLKQKHLDDESINYGLKVQEAARAAQSLHQLVLTLRDTYGLPCAMPPVMALWATCDVIIQSLSDMMLRGLMKVQLARQLASNVYRYLSATSPSPQELSALVHSPYMKVTTPVQPTLSTNVAANPFPETGRSSILSQIHSPGGSQLSTQRRAMKSTASSVPIKISFVLVGFQYLVSGAAGGDYSNAPGGTIRSDLFLLSLFSLFSSSPFPGSLSVSLCLSLSQSFPPKTKRVDHLCWRGSHHFSSTKCCKAITKPLWLVCGVIVPLHPCLFSQNCVWGCSN